MRLTGVSCGIILLALLSCIAALGQDATNSESSLTITAHSPSAAVAVGSHFTFPVSVVGGLQPYTWRLAAGNLPPGLTLHAHRGVIAGTPTAPGEYHFTVAVSDSSIPQLVEQREFTIIVVAGLTIDWKQYPQVQGNAISGSVVVSNATDHAMRLTVIVMAVNEIGRATALGYQHFTVEAQQSSPEIPFGSSPGPGKYIVHADAAAHVAGSHFVYRARKQTSAPLSLAH